MKWILFLMCLGMYLSHSFAEREGMLNEAEQAMLQQGNAIPALDLYCFRTALFWKEEVDRIRWNKAAEPASVFSFHLPLEKAMCVEEALFVMNITFSYELEKEEMRVNCTGDGTDSTIRFPIHPPGYYAFIPYDRIHLYDIVSTYAARLVWRDRCVLPPSPDPLQPSLLDRARVWAYQHLLPAECNPPLYPF